VRGGNSLREKKEEWGAFRKEEKRGGLTARKEREAGSWRILKKT